MPISRLLPAVVAVAVFSLSQSAHAATPLPQFYDANFQACLTEQAARNGWTSAEEVTVLSCPNRKIEMLGGVQQLMNLAELDLSNNAVRGVYDLGELKQLGKLNLAGNTSIYASDLGNTLSRLPVLHSLNLNGIRIGSINNLNGLISQTNWQPLPLVELDLGSTDLKDAGDRKTLEFLRNFTTLKKLNVADNGIDYAEALAAISDLEELDLSNNELPFVGALQWMSKLKRINLSGNSKLTVPEIAELIRRNPDLTSIKLNGIAIGNINNLGPLLDSRTGQPLNLTELDLGNTGLLDSNGDTTVNFLRPFVNLRSLNLASNGIRDVSALDQMQQLEELDLSGNQLDTLGGVSQLRNLTRLNLSGNRSLRFFEFNGFLANNPKLTRIGLNGIRIGTDTQWLNNLASNPLQANALLELDLGNTLLDASGLNALNAFPNLQRLNLAGNQFGMSVDYRALTSMRQLQDLDLSGNSFNSTYFLSEMTALRRLNLSHTAVRSADLRTIIDRNPNLRSLRLNSIPLSNISDLGDLRNRQTGQPLDLLELDLGNTGLQDGMNFLFLLQFPNLKSLNLAGNGIEELSVYTQLPWLRDLDLSNNRLRYFAPGGLDNLVRLNLSGNVALDVRTLTGRFANMSALRSLGLNGIEIGNISNLGPMVDQRTGLALNLLELDLGNTGLNDSDGSSTLGFLQQFANLRALNVANNGIRDALLLSTMPQLEELDLSGNQLDALGGVSQLRNLTRLNLSGNRNLRFFEFSGILGNNPKLTRIGLNGIRIGTDTQWLNTIAGNLQQANGLLELDLGNTALDASGLMPLTAFPNLQRLNLAGNQFSTSADYRALMGMRQMQDLDLSGNTFNFTPFLVEMTSLRRLNLSHTAVLSGDLPIIIDRNPNLRGLRLNSIPMSSIRDLGELRNRQTWQPLNLQELDLGNTGVRDSMSLSTLQQFPNLESLNLSGNGIEELNIYTQLPWLRDLDLSNNRLRYLVPGGLGNLVRLNLSGNVALDVRTLAGRLGEMSALRSLGLGGIAVGNINNLGPLVDQRTGRPLNLLELDLSNTGLTDSNGSTTLNFLQPFVNLRSLNVANNGFTDAFSLGSMLQLEELDLSGNQLDSPAGVSQLRKLTRLNLSGNRSLRFFEINSLLVGNPKLTHIGLNGIRVGADIQWLNFIAGNLLQAEGLLELDLGNTALDASGLMPLTAFPNLQRLNLAGNQFSMIADFRALIGMRQMQDLDLSGNIFNFTPFLGDMTGLRRLNLSHTAVRSADLPYIIDRNPNLRSLRLNSIPMSSIRDLGELRNRQTWQPLNLQELDLGNTGVRDSMSLSTLQQFPNLESLNLAGNGIEELNIYTQLPWLRDLDLSNNRLRYFSPGTLFNLVRLNLSGNVMLDVRTLAGGLGDMPALRSLGLGGVEIGNISNLGPLVDQRTGRPLNLLELDLSNTGLTDSNGNATLNFLQPFVNLRALNVANNGINDVTGLSSLTQLQELDLSGNQVVVVSMLAQQRNLTRLNLSGNAAIRMGDVAMMVTNNPKLNRIGINGIRNGQVSQWLVNLPIAQADGMLELDLGNTLFDANVLPNLSRFSNLQRLNLANLGLPAETDLQFLGISGKLIDLDLSGNALRNFYFIRDLSNLRRLNLSNTALLKEELPGIVNSMPYLTSLGLNGVPIGHFSNLGELRNRSTWEFLNLTELDLGNTGLEGQWGKRGFNFLQQFPNLQRLNLSGNGIEEISEYSQLSKLVDLDISNNRLSFVSSFNNNSRLQTLNLGGNTQLRVSDISPIIASNPDLRGLGLNGIAIGNINNLGPLVDMRNGQPLRLRAIDFGNTGVLDSGGQKTANFLAPFPNLQSVNLAGNGLTELHVIGSFAKLRELDVSNNAVQDIAPLIGLRNLSYLNLSANPIQNGSALRTLLDQSGNLARLGLNGIALRDISALGSLQHATTLQPYDLLELDLGNTLLSADGNSTTNWVGRFPGLQRLNLAGNGLADVRGMEVLKSLKDLDLSNNALPDAVPLNGLSQLNRLNLSGNTLLPGIQVGDILRQNSAITHLGLNGINLGSLPNVNYFSGRPGALPLVELDIGNTQMQDIDGLNFLQTFTRITRLNLSGNNLRSFNGVRALPELLHLDVSNNGMTLLWDVAIAKLQTLNLFGNNSIACAELDQFVSTMSNTAVTRPATCAMPNQPPTAAAGTDQTVSTGTQVTLAGSGVDSDGTIIRYDWTQIAGPAVQLVNADAATASFAMPEVTTPTVYSFKLTVTDDKLAFSDSTTNVTVMPIVNELPVADAGANQTVQEAANVVLAGVASDSDGTLVSHQWTQLAGPAVVLTTPNAVTSGFVAPAVTADTVFTFQLTVFDNKGASASGTTNVTVKPRVNAVPVVNAGANQSLLENRKATLAGSASDSDGSIVSYKWLQTSGPLVTLATPGAASTTFNTPLLTTDTVFGFSLTVTDNEGAVATSNTSVTVLNASELTVTALSSNKTSAARGSTITVTSTTRNSSNKPTAVATSTGFYLTKATGSVKTTDVFLGSMAVPANLTGYTPSTANQVIIPANLTPGVYYLGAIADYEGKLDETNEGNNTRSATKITVL